MIFHFDHPPLPAMWAGDKLNAMTQQFQHEWDVCDLTITNRRKVLKERGLAGWQLVSVIPDKDKGKIVFYYTRLITKQK